MELNMKLNHKILLWIIIILSLVIISFGIIDYNFDFFQQRQNDNNFLSQSEIKMYNNNDLDNLINKLTNQLHQNPNNQNILLSLSLAYLQKSNLDYNNKSIFQSRIYLRRVLNTHPNNPRALVLLAYSDELEMKYNQAINEYKQIISLVPTSAYLYNQLGHAYEFKGKYYLAIKNYYHALLLNKNLSETYINLARMYLKLGQFKVATAYYKKALHYTSNKLLQSGIYASLGSIYSNQKRTNENKKIALSYLNQAIYINPNNALAYSNIEEEYFLRLKDFQLEHNYSQNKIKNFQFDLEKIEKNFNRAITINPNQTSAYRWMALTLVVTKNYSEAIKVINSGIQATYYDNTLSNYERKNDLAYFYIIKSMVYAQNPEIKGNVKYSLMYLRKALNLNNCLLKIIIYPELDKTNNGYFSKIKNNFQFKQIINQYKH